MESEWRRVGSECKADLGGDSWESVEEEGGKEWVMLIFILVMHDSDPLKST